MHTYSWLLAKIQNNYCVIVCICCMLSLEGAHTSQLLTLLEPQHDITLSYYI